jgi:hypothetical protein
MGLWIDTTFVRHADVSAVARALGTLCAEEDMAPIAAPAPRRRRLVEPMQYDDALHNDLWALAVFAGAPGWTVVKTAPLQLLGGSRAADGAMRLARLCTLLGTSGLAIHLRDGTSLVLAEAAAAEEPRLSGFDASAPGDASTWQGRQIDAARFEPAFDLHPALAPLVAAGDSAEANAARIVTALGGVNAVHCGNDVAVGPLIAHRPIGIDGAIVLHHRWTGPSRQRFTACDSWDAWRAQVGPGR